MVLDEGDAVRVDGRYRLGDRREVLRAGLSREGEVRLDFGAPPRLERLGVPLDTRSECLGVLLLRQVDVWLGEGLRAVYGGDKARVDVGAEALVDGAEVRTGEVVGAVVVRTDDVDVGLSALLDLVDVRLDLATGGVEVRSRDRFQRLDPRRNAVESPADSAVTASGLVGADEEVGDGEVEEGDADEEASYGDALATANDGTEGLPRG